MKFSFIIITYNEELLIRNCITSIKQSRVDFEYEIILSDGGSTDSTIEIAKSEGVVVLNSPSGRGVQANYGARAATGDVFVFLHGDTLFPENGFKVLENEFSSGVRAGTFKMAFDIESPIYSLYSWFTGFDSIFTSFGDQCISVSKDLYYEVNGFPDWQIFEDVKFLQKARKITKIKSFDAKVITSSRRFEKNGIIIQQLRNFLYIIYYLFGLNDKKLKKLYSRERINRQANELILFAREPGLGKVKTRLAESLGEDFALKFYELCLEHTFDQTKNLNNISSNIFVNSSNSNFRFEQVSNAKFYSQPEGNLGSKITHAFNTVFSKRTAKAIIIGSDLPDINSAIIEEAFVLLNKYDFILGPSNDGGYYLLGMNSFHPELFEDIHWSSEEVLELTIKKINSINKSYYLLPELIDIDTEEDLKLWLKNGNNLMLKEKLNTLYNKTIDAGVLK